MRQSKPAALLHGRRMIRLAGTGLAALLLASGSWAAAPPGGGRADDELPDGEGRRILQASCTACHELTEITKFKGYYTRDDWRDIVQTMIEYGATVKPREADVLVDYLTKTLGRK